jgi:hypothetical protein
VYRKECFAGVYLRGEMHRFIPAILGWRGFRIGEMPVDHRQRKYGTSKYTFKRTLKGLLDMMSIWFFQKFSSRPLHLLGAIGLLLFVGGLVIGTWMVLIKIVWGQSLANLIWPLAAVFLMLSGMQMFVSGLIMDVIITSNDKLDYSIREKH